MVNCGECKYWYEPSGCDFAICERVDLRTLEIKEQEFYIDNDAIGQYEASYLVTGKNFGCVLGEYAEK